MDRQLVLTANFKTVLQDHSKWIVAPSAEEAGMCVVHLWKFYCVRKGS